MVHVGRSLLLEELKVLLSSLPVSLNHSRSSTLLTARRVVTKDAMEV